MSNITDLPDRSAKQPKLKPLKPTGTTKAPARRLKLATRDPRSRRR